MPPKLASGEFYYENLKHFKIFDVSRKILERVPLLEAEFASKQNLCSDTVAQTYLTGKMRIAVGCAGARTYTGMQELELTVGIFPQH